MIWIKDLGLRPSNTIRNGKPRNFTWALYKCEFCGHEETDNSMDSYDDRYFHDNVIPNVKCSKCGKSTNSEGGTVEHTATKYPEGYQI